MSTAQVIFVLGGPGAGKGTQCANISRVYGYVHLSMGDLLREELLTQSTDANLIRQHITQGTLVPIDIVMRLLQAAINKYRQQGKSKFLIDGFPRNKDNLEAWRRTFEGKNSDVRVQLVLFFDCPEEEMERRLLKRGETSGRDDDNAASIRSRFKTFKELSRSILDEYERAGLLRVVSALGSAERVFQDVERVFERCKL